MALWVCLTLGCVASAQAQTVPAIGGATACTPTGGTDVLFLLDNSDSIASAEYAAFASTVVSIGEALRTANPATRIGVAHYGGPYVSSADFGQYVFFERNFSTSAVASPIRRFGLGGSYAPGYTQDNLADAIFRMSSGLDGNAGTTSSHIVGPIAEMSRDLTRPLQIVIFTDAAYHLVSYPAGSSIIDGVGYAVEPNDASNFTIYNRLKAQGVKFSVAALSYDSYQAERDPAAAAISSVGGSWTGAVAANSVDPEGSQSSPRRLEVSTDFILNSTQIANFVAPVANLCQPTAYDYGDAPASYGAPSHMVVSGGPSLGPMGPDAESAPHHSADALGDDMNGVDDEDGVNFGTLNVGMSSLATVTLPWGLSSGYVNAWVDWSRDGDFLDAGEQIALNLRDDGTGVDGTAHDLQLQFLINAPSTALAGQSYYARFRLSSQADLAPHAGVAPDGEIEDHLVTVQAYAPPTGAPVGSCAGPNLLTNGDFGATTNWAVGYDTSRASGGYVVGLTGVNSTLTNAPVYQNASGVFRSYVDTDGNLGGVPTLHLRNETLINIVNGRSYVFNYDIQRIVNSANVDATINWVLVNASTNAIVQTIPGASGGIAGAPTTWTNRASTFVAAAPSGTYKLAMTFKTASISTQVLDYYIDRVYFAPLYSCDFGDAPASYGAPMHIIDGGLKLGVNAPDSESAPHYSADALGDDAHGVDDEDGVSAFPKLQVGATSYSIPAANLSATGAGVLRAWIDFNKNGLFSANEQASVNVAGGVLAGALNWTGIAIGAAGGSFARLRFTSTSLTDDTTTTALDERATTALAMNGEVEDYAVTFVAPDPRDNLTRFACASRIYQVYGPTGALASMRLSDGALVHLPNALGRAANAAGYRLSDNLVYAIAPTATPLERRLIAVGADGLHADLGVIAGLPTSFAYQSGDFGGDGYLHVKSSEDTVVHRINVDTVSVVSSYSSGAFPSSPADIAYNPADGYFYGVDRFAPQLWRFREGFPAAAVGAGGGYASGGDFSWGATFVMNGRFFAANNRNGSVYEFNTTTGFATYIGQTIDNLSGNDGFSCNQATLLPEADLAVAKTNGLSVLAPGQTTQYLVSVTNKQGATILGAILSDPAASGLQKLSVSCSATPGLCVAPPSVAELEAGSFALPLLTAGASYEILVTAEVVAPAGVSVANVASVLMPPGYAELTPQDNLARDADPVGGLTLSPHHESTVPAGQIVMYRHELHVASGLEAGEVEFSLLSDQGLDWRIHLDRSEAAPHAPDGIFGAGDLLLPSGPYALNGASSLAIWLVAQVPQETPAGWRDLTRLIATWTKDGAAQTKFVEDLTHVSGEEGRIVARKLIASDLDCDGLADGPFAMSETTIRSGSCALYEISFENLGTQPIREVKVHDDTPDWTLYVPGSAQVLSHPAGLTPQTPNTPAAWTEGEILFPFLGALQPGEAGAVRFGVQLRSSRGAGVGGND